MEVTQTSIFPEYCENYREILMTPLYSVSRFLCRPHLTRDHCRCDRAGAAGTIRLAAVRCPAGLAFDIYRQTCDWKAKVDNCDQLSSE